MSSHQSAIFTGAFIAIGIWIIVVMAEIGNELSSISKSLKVLASPPQIEERF